MNLCSTCSRFVYPNEPCAIVPDEEECEYHVKPDERAQKRYDEAMSYPMFVAGWYMRPLGESK